MKTVKTIIAFLMLITFSCKSPTERWLNGMADFKETRSKALTLQAMKIRQETADTASFSYKVRIYLKDPRSAQRESVNFYYHMDSCFTIRSGNALISPVIMQPVNNGIANCYEYLLSFSADKAVKLKAVQLVYRDRFTDGKEYVLDLNK